MKLGIIRTLGELFGKEVSEELAKEFQDEMDDFKKLLTENRFIENMPNLELETYAFEVKSAGKTIVKDFKTKIEHKKIIGVFTSYRNGHESSGTNYDSILSIQVDRKYLVANGFFHFILIEKTNNYSIYEAAWRTDTDIDTSDIHIEYKDASSLAVPYKVYVNFICQK